ncbi:Nucleolar protein 58 [Eumeta japonica]|uniref:Nucleolar protein 58 n=1 Tax=Eumeta variegata TaxID=151549 RepID=A0A4C1SPF0_EUMVA|nr:Nucleolar protein 58 [Eumeta japonica]
MVVLCGRRARLNYQPAKTRKQVAGEVEVVVVVVVTVGVEVIVMVEVVVGALEEEEIMVVEQGGGGGGDSKCYDCGDRGHYARDCHRHGRSRRRESAWTYIFPRLDVEVKYFTSFSFKKLRMFVLYETPAGYAIFKLLDEKKMQEVDNLYLEFQTPDRANKLLKLKHFEKFNDTIEALAAATAAVEGKMSKPLKNSEEIARCLLTNLRADSTLSVKNENTLESAADFSTPAKMENAEEECQDINDTPSTSGTNSEKKKKKKKNKNKDQEVLVPTEPPAKKKKKVKEENADSN